MTRLLVLPSPFLGASAYGPLIEALSGLGHAAAVAPCPAEPDATELVAAWASRAAGASDVVLVPHSNAGYLAPAVADAAGAAVVFVDAALPAGSGTTRMAPAVFRSRLAELAGPDGRLPRWTRWWPRAELAAVLPDPLFERLDAVVPEVPLGYVDSKVVVPDGWEARRCAYLALGVTYADELAIAARHDWPRRRLDHARHLHPVVEPEETAAAVLDLVAKFR